MSTWDGYRVAKIGGGGLQNDYATPKAKQAWDVGAVVKVGFVSGLVVTGKTNGVYSLTHQASGRRYVFEPHCGLSRVN